MKSLLMFIYSIIAYLIGFVSLLLLIIFVSGLVPQISIDGTPEIGAFPAILKNMGLVLLFAIQHSVMARKSFKNWISSFMPKPIERSTYVLVTGVLLTFIIFEWEPLGGMIWAVDPGTPLYYALYALFFIGWGILFVSTFLINHFDLFGLRQTFMELQGKPYTPLKFKVFSLYKYVRHPLYLGGIIGLWATPVMSATHLVCAIGMGAYFVIGAFFEEKDLIDDFGQDYLDYKAKTSMIIPLPKTGKKIMEKVEVS